jgi:hypothetical protein
MKVIASQINGVQHSVYTKPLNKIMYTSYKENFNGLIYGGWRATPTASIQKIWILVHIVARQN